MESRASGILFHPDESQLVKRSGILVAQAQQIQVFDLCLVVFSSFEIPIRALEGAGFLCLGRAASEHCRDQQRRYEYLSSD